MPSVPEIPDGSGKERLSEVFRQRDIETLGDTDHDINASREVGVELRAVHQDAQNAVSSQGHVVVKYCAHVQCRIIGNDHFLEEAPCDSVKTALNASDVKCMLRTQLLGKLAVP